MDIFGGRGPSYHTGPRHGFQPVWSWPWAPPCCRIRKGPRTAGEPRLVSSCPRSTSTLLQRAPFPPLQCPFRTLSALLLVSPSVDLSGQARGSLRPFSVLIFKVPCMSTSQDFCGSSQRDGGACRKPVCPSGGENTISFFYKFKGICCNSPTVGVNVNFFRGDDCRRSSLLIPIPWHAGQESQLSLKY